MMKKIFNYLQVIFKKKYVKYYRNAELYEILGQDYERIMYFSFGKDWYYINLKDNYKIVNTNLGTSFNQSDSLDLVLYKIKMFYMRNLGDISKIPYYIEGKVYLEKIKESINVK